MLVFNAQELKENSVIMNELFVTSSMMASELGWTEQIFLRRYFDMLVLNAQELKENSVIMNELFVTSSMMASELGWTEQIFLRDT